MSTLGVFLMSLLLKRGHLHFFLLLLLLAQLSLLWFVAKKLIENPDFDCLAVQAGFSKA